MTSKMTHAVLVSLLALAACHERQAPTQPSKPSVQSVSEAAPPDAAAQAKGGAAPTRESLIEPARDLGGTLPLKHGIFVASDIPCSDPPNAAIRRYDGQGLSGAHTRDCRINVLAKEGKAYEIDQSCIDAGSGPAPRSSERATVEIQDNLTFTLKRGSGAETFRYCAASLLPPGLREWG